MKKIIGVTMFLLSFMLNVQQNPEELWSDPVNGLIVRMVFDVEESQTHSQVIHPKLLVKNETKDTLNFFWCIYDAGEFTLTDSKGSIIANSMQPRSGPVGAKVKSIKPGEIIAFDAYDYGYGVSKENSIYTFNTHYSQMELEEGDYFVDYRLDYSKENLKKIINRYDWINIDIDSLWTGKLSLKKGLMKL